MGNTTTTPTPGSVNVCFTDYEEVFNMQQNTFSNSMFLDIRSSNEYNKSHIDQSHHVKFASSLLSLNLHNKTSKEYKLYKQWLEQIIKLHQSTYCKTKITFYIVHDNDKEMNLIQSICEWLNDLYYDKINNISQIETSQYYYINFQTYKSKYPFICSDHKYYEEGRLFPSQITSNIYLCNWGIASDGCVFKLLNNIKYIINVTCDHPNIYNVKSDQKSIYSEQFLCDIAKSMVIKGNTISTPGSDIDEKDGNNNIEIICESNPMFKRQNQKIIELRNEFKDVRLNYFRVPVVDNPNNNIMQYFQKCCHIIENGIQNNSDILIHCRHGQSRSATITAAWLIYKKGLTVNQSLQFIKTKRPRISPNAGFIKQLNDWYKQCMEIKLANKTAFAFPKSDNENENENENIQIQSDKIDNESVTNTETETQIQKQQLQNDVKTDVNINQQLNKSIDIQNEQKDANNKMNDMEAKIKLLTQKKNENDSENKNENEKQIQNETETENTDININRQLNKSIDIQTEQKNANEEMNDMESKIKLLTQKKDEQISENVTEKNGQNSNEKPSDSAYYLYPSTDQKEAEKYKPSKIDNTKIKQITNKMDTTVINGSSKWNNGATMETFDFSDWMSKRLKEILINEIKFNDKTFKIYEIININSCATILLVRKQYKFGYDIKFECKWKGEYNGNNCNGILKMDDITNDDDINNCLYDVTIENDSEENEYGMGIIKDSKDIVISGVNKLIQEFYKKKQS